MSIKRIGRTGGRVSAFKKPGSFIVTVKATGGNALRFETFITSSAVSVDPVVLCSSDCVMELVWKYYRNGRATVTQSTVNAIRAEQTKGSTNINDGLIDQISSIDPNCSDGTDALILDSVAPMMKLTAADGMHTRFRSRFTGGTGRTVCNDEGSHLWRAIITGSSVEVYKKPLSGVWNVEIKKL